MKIGVVLNPADTRNIKGQLLEDYEAGKVFEGKFVAVRRSSDNIRLLGRLNSISPHNAFYTSGDAWSETRRKGLEIPKGVSRTYEIIDIDLLLEIKGGPSIRIPPKPGDQIEDLTSEDLTSIFGKSLNLRIPFGHLPGYPETSIPLKVESIPMHFAVFGKTGSGKSFNMGILLQELSKINSNGKKVAYPCVFIDAHGDYIDFVKHFQNQYQKGLPIEKQLRYGNIYRYVFPRRQISGELGPNDRILALDLDALGPRSVAELAVLFTRGNLTGADMQVNGLEAAFELAKERGISDNLNELFINERLFDDFLNIVRNVPTEILHQSSRVAVLRAARSFRREIEKEQKLLSSKSPLIKGNKWIDDLVRNKELMIIDFSSDGAPGITFNLKRLVVAYIAKRLFDKFVEYTTSGKNKNVILAIEEAQIFAPSKSFDEGGQITHQILSAIATQGRKFGLSLGLISQRPAFLDPVIVSMCNTFFIQRISQDDISFVSKVTGGLSPSITKRLTNLGTGEVIISGQMIPTPFPLLVRISKESRIVSHETGTVDMLGVFAPDEE